jgi:hypothetical protein
VSTALSDPPVAEEEARQVDLSVFHELNERDKKVPWSERYKVIKEQFPSVAELDWNEALRKDVDLFGRILRDIIKLDQAEPGRSGPRRAVDPNAGHATLRMLAGQDYSELPFNEAFRVLGRGMSLTTLARKTSLSRMTCSRLLRAEKVPDADEMRLVAEAFKKHPSYFIEYRVAYVTAAIAERLASAPESSIVFYKKLAGEK